jgi:CRISPR-associated endonuclease/helicase Cas3
MSISEPVVARLSVLAALHDIGKLNIGFQAKGRQDLGSTAGHVMEALSALFQPVFACLQCLGDWGESVTDLLIASLCHHGRPHNETLASAGWQESWWRPRGGLDPRAGAENMLGRCRLWFPDAFLAQVPPLPGTSDIVHAFAGLVMLADWIASDTAFFPFSMEGEGDRMAVSRARARRAVARMGLNVPTEHRLGASGRNAFERVVPADYQPRPLQTAIMTLPHEPNGSTTILEAETGSGKTEAALARFVSLFEAGLVDGMYFALPTRSAATEMHGRVLASARRAFHSPPPVVLAVPGYYRADDKEGERLPPFKVLWPDHDRFRDRGWAAENSKRYLVGCILVGTVDQVLLSSLMVGHAHLRATALLRHLLVVDEVHASDAYMGRVLEDVLARHAAAGGHALLLSATLGGESRARLLSRRTRVTMPALSEMESAPYPLLSHRGDGDREIAIPQDSSGRAIEVHPRPWLENAPSVAAAAFAAALQGAKVLVIRNTVADCIATQVAVEEEARRGSAEDLLFRCDGVAAPHHARFAAPDRTALDLALEKCLGKERTPGGCIVVATQTVQQSLDLDADVLLSDLCPADVLLQRLGRLHRHARARPTGFEKARAIVITPEARDLGVLIGNRGVPRSHHGLGSVYPDLRILEATWRLLELHQEWRIPAMNRHLVERSLHSSVLRALVAELGPRWQEHAVHVLGVERGHARVADLNLVDWSRSYAETSFPNSAEQRIPTRLGDDDRRAVFEPPFHGPFGRLVEELRLQSWWVRGAASDAVVRVLGSDQTGMRFEFAGKTFLYDRHGLRPTEMSHKEVVEDDGP